MSAADGTVIGITKIFDSGTPGTRWNLVFLSDGYQASELAQYVTDANDVVDRLLAKPPFDRPEIQCGINAYRIDVTSTESGADKPSDCSDGLGPSSPQTRATYFDSRFCSNGAIWRLVSGDKTLAQDTVEALLPEWDQIIVICNDPERGGAGGQVAWTTNSGSDWREVAIHELGHSAFGLADEYDYGGPDSFDDDEPDQPNVTKDSNPATCKWSAQVTAGSANPTRANSDCTTTDPGPSPVAAGVVGTFEGAKYSHCGCYRPVWNCMMRDTGALFCPVCTATIVDVMSEFNQPAPSGDVSLANSTVDFNDVPTGLSVVRAARFNVSSCTGVTFQVMAAPSAPFALESLAVLPVSPAGAAPWPAYVWFRLNAGAVGSVPSQLVTIRCLETAEDFVVTLTGNVIERPTVATQLVFDQSSSMLDTTDEGRTKEQVLKDSATAFVDLMWDDNGIGINAYDQDPHPIMDVAVANAPGDSGGRDAAIAAIAAHASNPSGLTAIGDGIELARTKLDGAPGSWANKAMIVLTDGIETAGKYIEDVADSVIDNKVFAIGMGTAEQIQPAALNALTSGTGGYLLMTGNLGADETFLLEKYYVQILAGVNNNEIVVDPEGWARPGVIDRIPFDVTDSDVEITAMVLGRPANVLTMALQAPDGQVVPISNASLIGRTSPRTIFMRAGLPLLAGGAPAHGGRWHLLLTLNRKYLGRDFGAAAHESTSAWPGTPSDVSVRYSASVAAWSNLRMAAAVHQSSLEPGATLMLAATLAEYGAPFLGSASVRVEMTRPDGSTVVVPLGAVSGETGRFQASRIAVQTGIYRCHFLATGRTSREQSFTREAIRTPAVWHGGDNPGHHGDGGTGGGGPGGGGPGGGGWPGGGGGWPGGGGGWPGGGGGWPGGGGGWPGGGGGWPGGGGGWPGGGGGGADGSGGGSGGRSDWCDFLGCLFADGVLSAELVKRLKGAGLDLGRLRDCLARACSGNSGGGGCGSSKCGCQGCVCRLTPAMLSELQALVARMRGAG